MPITNTNTKPTAPFVVSISPPSPVAGGGFTIGLDLMDRSHYVCVLDAAGEIPHEGSMLNDQVALAAGVLGAGSLPQVPATAAVMADGMWRSKAVAVSPFYSPGGGIGTRRSSSVRWGVPKASIGMTGLSSAEAGSLEANCTINRSL